MFYVYLPIIDIDRYKDSLKKSTYFTSYQPTTSTADTYAFSKKLAK